MFCCLPHGFLMYVLPWWCQSFMCHKSTCSVKVSWNIPSAVSLIWYTFRISFSAICWRSVVLRQVFRAAKVNASGIYWQFQKHIECKLNAHAIYRQRLVLRLSTKIFDSIFRDFLKNSKLFRLKFLIPSSGIFSNVVSNEILILRIF